MELNKIKPLAEKLLISVGFFCSSLLLLGGMVYSLEKYDLDKCELQSEAITVKAVAAAYEDCKSRLVEVDFEKYDARFFKVTSQLQPKTQITHNTKDVFLNIFDDVQKEYRDLNKDFTTDLARLALVMMLGLFFLCIYLSAKSFLWFIYSIDESD